MTYLIWRTSPIIIVGVMLVYAVSLLIFNADRGLDITDESHYILGSVYPSDVFSVITHENYYTGFLFKIAGQSLEFHRVLGVLIVLVSSFWLATELIRYLDMRFKLHTSRENKIFFVLVILIASLAFYGSWILTPSYNWLSVVAMILITAAVLRAVNRFKYISGKWVVPEYLYLGLALTLSFASKPTSLVALFPTFLLFVIVHVKSIDFTRSLAGTSSVLIAAILGHLIILDGGVSEYMSRLNECLVRLATMGGGHTFKNILHQAFVNLKNILEAILTFKLVAFVFISFFITRYLHKRKVGLIITTIIFVLFSTYFLVNSRTILPFSIEQKFYIVLLLLSAFVFLIYLVTENTSEIKSSIYIQTGAFFVFMAYQSIAVSFGTGNNIWFHASVSYIFPATGLLGLVYIMDRYHSSINNLKPIAGILVSVFVLVILNNAYSNPYRLNTSVKHQVEKVDLLGGIKVDSAQKSYLENLILIRNTHDLNNTIMIDTTGASPGANIALNAKFFQQPWLLGGYPGSNEFAYRILRNMSKEQLESSWILTAPLGSRTLNLKILEQLGVHFPEDYDLVTELYFYLRNEKQYLWRPKTWKPQLLK